jgi:hypothetical protein
MPLNKLENFIKNYEGRILYVNSNDLDATDSITNQGNSLTKPFKTIQRALIEASRFSFLVGNNNDNNARTTILVFPGDHTIDNRPGFGIKKTGTALAQAVAPNGNTTEPASDVFSLNLESNFDINQEDNILYKFNSVEGGVIIPRGTSIVGLDLRKTRIRPKYVPNPTDLDVPSTAVFRVTGLCYFWQFSFFDADESGLVYTNNRVFTPGSGNLSTPTFSHHKLTCFEYADGVNIPGGFETTDLDMYYAKLSNAFNEGSGRQIPSAQKFPLAPDAFAKERPEWEIVGAFAADPITISDIISGDGATPDPVITVTTVEDHELNVGTPIKIRGIDVDDYNVSTTVASVTGEKTFTYLLSSIRSNLPADPSGSGTVTIETDTVKGASPYIFNCSLRSVWGMNGLTADGAKADGFRSMVLAQFTAVSLQKDDRAFVKYNAQTRSYDGISVTKVTGSALSSGSASTNSETVYHLDQQAVYRRGWETGHVQQRNDSILQIVSVFAIGFNRHFSAESGADASITNSNSNFGQTALVADGFKKKAFDKDDHGYITHVISPKSIRDRSVKVDWIPIDVGLTTAVGITSHLYLFGFNTKDNVPPNLISGYRVGARQDEKLFLDLPATASVRVASCSVFMTDTDISGSQITPTGSTSSKKEFIVVRGTQSPDFNFLVLDSNHNLRTGEKVIVISDDADLPEGLNPNRPYYVITTQNANQIKLASTPANASNDLPLKLYGGSNLRIISRVTDRDSGEIGSPIQYDPNNSNWFVYVNQDNEIYDQLNTLGVVGFAEDRTDVTFFKRIADNRSIDDKIYKVRFVIPKETTGAKDPQEGFVLQESSITGALTDAELSLSTIDADNVRFKRNPGFISTCSVATNEVTIITEQPHKLDIGDRVLIKNVKSTGNPTGVGVSGYNGDFVVDSVVDTMTFTYSTTDRNNVTHNVGDYTGSSSAARDTNLPRFERNDLESNLYIYRRDIISPYVENVSDGIYHLYVLNSSNQVTEEFTNYEYEQNVTNLYPQLDRDNKLDNPGASKSFAQRFPLGEVQTNDLQKSITRETVDIAFTKFGITPKVLRTSPISVGVATITTKQDHGLNGIIDFSVLTGGSGFDNGSYFSVRLYSDNTFTIWQGATADVTVTGGSITSVTIASPGSGYSAGETLYFQGFAGASITINAACLSSPDNNALQVTGLGTVTDGLYRISSIPSRNEIAIAKTSGDPEIFENQIVFNIGPSASVSTRVFDALVGITTITTSTAHGLVAGNQLRILDSSDNNLGDFIVKDSAGITTFTVGKEISSDANRVLKHGFNANDFTSGVDGENLGSRGIPLYDNQFGSLVNDLTTASSGGKSSFAIATNSVQGSVGVGTTARFPLGSYIEVNEEIMRVASSTLTGSGSNEITVLRGSLGTAKQDHPASSLIKKIKPIAIELRRPSILRASGHTFEYLGYGPGNYSTGLPQVQVRTLTEREDFLAQAQEKSGGQVVYTGMNSDGDFFIGNTKYSASSGKQQTFDIPIPTVAGQDPSRLSVVFDEVIVKERILVEGGSSNQILSQFDGPVTFNGKVIFNDELKLEDNFVIGGEIISKNETQSNSCTTGAIRTLGGLGVSKNVNICGDLNVAGISTFNGGVQINTGLFSRGSEEAFLGRDDNEWSGAWIGGIGIATEGVAGGTEVEDRTIRGITGDLLLGTTADDGFIIVDDHFKVEGDTTLERNLNVTSATGISTFANDVDINGKADIDNVRIDGNTVSTTSGDLTIDAAGDNVFFTDTTQNTLGNVNTGAAQFDGGVGIAKNLTVGGDLNVKGSTTLGDDPNSDTVTINAPLTVNNNINLGNNTIIAGGGDFGNIQIAITNDNTIDTTSGNLVLDSNGGLIDINDNVDISGNLVANGNVDLGNATSDTITATGRFDSHLIPTPDGTRDLGASSLEWRDLFIDGTAHIDTLDVDGNGTVAGTFAVASTTNLNGDVNLGNATSDSITATGRFDSHLVPKTDNAYDLGASNLEWRNLYIDGTAKIDTLTVDGNGTVAGTFAVNGNTTIGNASGDSHTFNGNVDMNHNLNVDGSTTLDGTRIDGNLDLNGSANISSNLDVVGNLDVDGATSLDNTTINGTLDMNGTATTHLILPDGDNTRDLGSPSRRWQDIYGVEFHGTLVGGASQVQTTQANNSNGFLVFADTNNAGTSTQTLKTGSHLTYSGGNLVITGGGSFTGDLTAFASDDRLKTNKLPITGALNKTLSLNGFTYNWNEIAGKFGLDTEITYAGVSAQDVQKVLPEAVRPAPVSDEYIAVQYEKLVPLLIEAIKELNAKVEDLEDKLSDK